ncbi:MAG: homoserine dehydrogenase [Clostridia bacterium]|jgi:homoserine dehydrogenase|nr:homoserine dehydrogenase [Clostridia bacterium]MCX4367144.1 homoserine dehydrogenase [Clostridia bacterium]
MKKVGVAILGFGTVGQGAYKILLERKETIAKEYGVDISVKAVLVRNKEKAIAAGADESALVTDIKDILDNENISIVAECIGGVDPAKGYILSSLKSGKSIVTANKELFAKNWIELEKVASENNVGLYYEATTGGGIPIIRTMTEAMQANDIKEIKGIINGTTNYILTRMTNEGADYADVLKDAQALGFAEANPIADVEGYDASYKISILATLAFNRVVPVELIYREGISKIAKEDIEYGKRFGLTVKLLAIAKMKDDGKYEVRVHPAFIPSSHPLASVSGSFNAVFIVGDNVGDIMLYGRGAGSFPTGSAVVSDIVFAARQIKHARYDGIEKAVTKEELISDFESSYYLRLNVHDVAGVLAEITKLFAKYGVSIASMVQQEGKDTVSIIFVTHATRENNMKKACEGIEKLTDVVKIANLIRIEK